jgi:predicted nucleic acid-binding protein
MTSFLTIDASLTFKLTVPNLDQERYERLLTNWRRDGYQLCAPTLWAYEMTSALTKMNHFGIVSRARCQELLANTFQLGVELVAPSESLARRAFDWTIRLNRIAAYDSFYLAVAESLGCELWTADRRLSNAVDEDWVRFAGKI